MIKIKKGDIFYFLNIFNKNDFLYLKIEALKDSETKHGMATQWKVLETNKHWFTVGKPYAGNQFDGVPLDGLEKHAFRDQKSVIRYILEGISW